MENIYDALTNPQPTWIDGRDFFALNYGIKYSEIRVNQRKIVISGNQISYFSLTPESQFPSNVHFNAAGPNVPLTEATHVGDYQTIKIDLSLKEIVSILKERGMSIATATS